MHIPWGWYCVGAQSGRRVLLGRALDIKREHGALTVHDGDRAFPVREVLGLGMVWWGEGSPQFDLPWARLSDPSWHFRPASVRTIETDMRRPFLDYFDHWHTAHVHRIPYRVRDLWFDGPRAGVSWEANITPLHLDKGGKRKLPTFRTTSSATLYGIGFAVDELSQFGIPLVNVQCNTPIDDTHVEMHTIVGMKRPPLLSSLASIVSAIVERAVISEVNHDVAYWRTCRMRKVVRDEHSDRDMQRLHAWCDSLA